MRVPMPLKHLSLFTILVGPFLRNLAIPSEAVKIEVKKVVTKSSSTTMGLSHESEFRTKFSCVFTSTHKMRAWGADSKKGSGKITS